VHESYAEVPNSMDLTPGFAHALLPWRNTQLQKLDHASNCQQDFKLTRLGYDRRVLRNKERLNGNEECEESDIGSEVLRTNIYVPFILDFLFGTGASEFKQAKISYKLFRGFYLRDF
jgi:hypothetical protein